MCKLVAALATQVLGWIIGRFHLLDGKRVDPVIGMTPSTVSLEAAIADGVEEGFGHDAENRDARAEDENVENLVAS